MHTKTRKLALTRETLRRLDGSTLRRVHGGTRPPSAPVPGTGFATTATVIDPSGLTACDPSHFGLC